MIVENGIKYNKL